ncbi:hypothetical protein HMPREF0294_0922 [Corynebacterium glucuronolyticum ATCC 51867]|nr:hypothetical protein HMPREF0294_0922 [Corynebacterium glucuronolyticum ATCC 51867]
MRLSPRNDTGTLRHREKIPLLHAVRDNGMVAIFTIRREPPLPPNGVNLKIFFVFFAFTQLSPHSYLRRKMRGATASPGSVTPHS